MLSPIAADPGLAFLSPPSSSSSHPLSGRSLSLFPLVSSSCLPCSCPVVTPSGALTVTCLRVTNCFARATVESTDLSSVHRDQSIAKTSTYQASKVDSSQADVLSFSVCLSVCLSVLSTFSTNLLLRIDVVSGLDALDLPALRPSVQLEALCTETTMTATPAGRTEYSRAYK